MKEKDVQTCKQCKWCKTGMNNEAWCCYIPYNKDDITGLEDDENQCEDFRQRKEPKTCKVEVTLSQEVYEKIREIVVGMSIDQWCASAIAEEVEKYWIPEDQGE